MSGFISFKKLPQKVLIVEDEIITRTSLVQILDSYFATIHCADDGDTGLDMYYRIKPDIIFSDIVMPSMNGIEMLRHIKECEDNTPLIIIFSAFDTTINDKDLEEIGVFRKMIKPFNMKALENLIEEIKQL
ncbi:response regulator [Deferribacteres bacterium DY0037]